MRPALGPRGADYFRSEEDRIPRSTRVSGYIFTAQGRERSFLYP